MQPLETCDELSKCSVRSETGEWGNKRHVMLREELSKFDLFLAQPGNVVTAGLHRHVWKYKKMKHVMSCQNVGLAEICPPDGDM